MSTTLHPSTTSAGPGAGRAPRPRLGLAGLGAGVLGIVGGIASGMVNAVYDPAASGDAVAITEKLATQVPQIIGFHTATMLSCVLLVLFAVGLHRQLRARTAPDSLVPGSPSPGSASSPWPSCRLGLATEFAFALTEDAGLRGARERRLLQPLDRHDPMAVGWRRPHRPGPVPRGPPGCVRVVARWTSLVLGGLSALFLISPLQYMAGMTGTAMARRGVPRPAPHGPRGLTWRPRSSRAAGRRLRGYVAERRPACSAGHGPSPATRTPRGPAPGLARPGSPQLGADPEGAPTDAYVRRTITRQHVSCSAGRGVATRSPRPAPRALGHGGHPVPTRDEARPGVGPGPRPARTATCDRGPSLLRAAERRGDR